MNIRYKFVVTFYTKNKHQIAQQSTLKVNKQYVNIPIINTKNFQTEKAMIPPKKQAVYRTPQKP